MANNAPVSSTTIGQRVYRLCGRESLRYHYCQDISIPCVQGKRLRAARVIQHQISISRDSHQLEISYLLIVVRYPVKAAAFSPHTEWLSSKWQVYPTTSSESTYSIAGLLESVIRLILVPTSNQQI